jgi:hypothetical protein
MPSSPSVSNDLAHPASRLLREAVRPTVGGEVVVLVVPRSGGADALAARVFKAAEGAAFRSVIVMASARKEMDGRIHLSRRESYPSAVGSIPVDLKSVDELCDEDDDIYADDRGLYTDDGIGDQLPWLRAALGEFALVPVVMGDESPDYCRELGAAVGEVMYNQPTLLVACVDVLEASAGELKAFGDALAANDVGALMRAVMSERIRLDGSGPLLAALLAADRRGARRVTVLELTAPAGAAPGRLGALVTRA